MKTTNVPVITIIILDSPKDMGFDRAHTQIHNFLLFIEKKIVGKRAKKSEVCIASKAVA